MTGQLTYNIAFAIASYSRFELIKFYKNAFIGEVIFFSHYNFFYSYPEFGKKWPNEKPCQFHRVNVGCKICGEAPDRNYAGVGNIYLLNTGRFLRFDCLCHQHAKGYLEFVNTPQGTQLKLL